MRDPRKSGSKISKMLRYTDRASFTHGISSVALNLDSITTRVMRCTNMKTLRSL
jgi:hypothetical protein